jgi:hypothetical protein
MFLFLVNVFILFLFSFSLKNFSIEYAGTNFGYDQVKATSIEMCKCPKGYTGSSCEV